MRKIKMPDLPLTGGCQCGAVRYSACAAPSIFYLCHCSECQRHTSSGFGQSMRFQADELDISGELKTVRRLAESGRVREGHFCPACGVRIFNGTAGLPVVTIKAGTLDDTRWLSPAGHIWTRSKQPFMRFNRDELVYDTQPDDNYAALAARWQAMIEAA